MHAIVTSTLLVLTGVCAYGGVVHAICIAYNRPFARVHSLFAATCLILVAWELIHFLTYTAPTLTVYIPRLKWEISAICLLFMVYPWFIGEYSGLRPRGLLIGLTLLAVVLLVVNVFQPYSLQYTQIGQLLQIHLPWGETIAQPAGENGIGYFVGVAGVLVAFAFSVYALVVRFYRDRMGTTLAMLIAVGIFVVSGIEGILVRMSVIDFISLGPFGILAMVIAMSVALSQEVQNKISASERRYHSLVEQSPFSIQILSPDGRTLKVNRSWEALWGVTEKQVTNYNPLHDQQLRDKGVMPYLEQAFNGSATEIPPIKYNPVDSQQLDGPYRDRWVRAFIYPVKDKTGALQEVVLLHEDVTEKKRLEDAIRLIATGVPEAGEGFFQQLVKSLSELFDVQYAFIGVLDTPQSACVRTMAVYANGQPAPNISYELKGSPCETVAEQRICVFSQYVQQQFPRDYLLEETAAEGFVGTALFDASGQFLGVIVLIDKQPLHDIEQMKAIMEIVAARTAAEIERNKADELLQKQSKSLQQMVEKRTAELQNALSELEAFSYSVSHDLRAPLRSIDGFSQALAEDYADILDEEGKDFLHRVRTSAQHMGTLIDDLLQLSRVTSKDIHRERVNLSELVMEYITKCQEQYPQRKVELSIAADVFANGDPDLLAIAINNLVSNAWKYTSKTKHAVIEFGTERQDDEIVYYIKDNGAGFDMKYAHKLFVAFQRLHSPQEYEGTGIGLATVVRVINRHGGSIWADAKPNQGATFYFTLPDTD